MQGWIKLVSTMRGGGDFYIQNHFFGREDGRLASRRLFKKAVRIHLRKTLTLVFSLRKGLGLLDQSLYFSINPWVRPGHLHLYRNSSISLSCLCWRTLVYNILLQHCLRIHSHTWHFDNRVSSFSVISPASWLISFMSPKDQLLVFI